jgi:hypothetical protein
MVYIFKMDSNDNIIRLVNTSNREDIAYHIMNSYKLPEKELNSKAIIDHYFDLSGMYNFSYDKYCAIDMSFDINTLIDVDNHIYGNRISMSSKAMIYLRNDKLIKIGI